VRPYERQRDRQVAMLASALKAASGPYAEEERPSAPSPTPGEEGHERHVVEIWIHRIAGFPTISVFSVFGTVSTREPEARFCPRPRIALPRGRAGAAGCDGALRGIFVPGHVGIPEQEGPANTEDQARYPAVTGNTVQRVERA